MNSKLHKTFIAAAIASFIALPAAAADDAAGGYPTDTPQVESGQPTDTMPWTESAPGQATPGAEPDMAAPDTLRTDNPLYARTPEELNRAEVIDPTGEKIGRIKTVVLGPTGDSAHAVISSGGFLGLGAREVIVSLDELQLVEDDKLQVNASEEELHARGDYTPEEFVELAPDRPISEFSAFEPLSDEPAMPRLPQ